MSEDMVERVARALWRDRHPDAQWSESEHQDYCGHARAAIEAMREPSKVMIAKGLKAIEESLDSTQDSVAIYTFPIDGTAYHGWTAMIDAALSHQGNESE